MITFAAVKLTENYDQLKAAFEPVIVEINEIIEQKEIMVCGQTVTLDIVFGIDLKVYRPVMVYTIIYYFVTVSNVGHGNYIQQNLQNEKNYY